MKSTLGPRFGAFAIDYMIFFAADIACIFALGQPNNNGTFQVAGWPGLVPLAFWLLWLVVPEWLWGATLGKKILGLKVQTADGRRLSFGSALIRRACDFFDFWISCGLVAIISYLKTSRGQRLGDMAAEVQVILQRGDPVGTGDSGAAPRRV